MSLFLKLVRWPNLVFILLTQILFEFCILRPLLMKTTALVSGHAYAFILVAVAYVLIAAAGYIINDYFDIPIDIINKPDKVFITNGMSKETALGIYGAMNLLAITLGWLASNLLHNHSPLIFITTCVILLFLYSAIMKKQFLIGNVMVSAIVASAMPVLFCMEMNMDLLLPAADSHPAIMLLSGITYSYTGFAFIISFSREMIKDLEDIEGDKQFGGRTVPIVLGASSAHRIVGGTLLILIFVLIYLLSAVWLKISGSLILTLYTILLVIIPLTLILWKLFNARQKIDYQQLSSLIKKVMLSGILSMLLYKFFTL